MGGESGTTGSNGRELELELELVTRHGRAHTTILMRGCFLPSVSIIVNFRGGVSTVESKLWTLNRSPNPGGKIELCCAVPQDTQLQPSCSDMSPS